MIELHNADCFDILPNIASNSVDLVILDLPYNQVGCKWDLVKIDLVQLWKHLKRIGKPRTAYIFTCTTRYGHQLIESNKKMFKYDLVWHKTMSVGFYHANQMPLRSHEMIYVFYDKLCTYNPQFTEGVPYHKTGGKHTELYPTSSPKIDTVNKNGKRFTLLVVGLLILT